MSLPAFFKTIAKESTGEFKDKGSKFIAYAFPIHNESDCKQRIQQLRKEHHTAAHVCWAYVLGLSSEIVKSSDDREPAGSAGRPILGALQSAQLSFTGIAVVRYFGGKLLGVPGLIHAYGSAANEALTAANWVQKDIFYRIFVAADFQIQHEIIRLCKQNSVKFYPDMQNQNQGITFEVAPAKKDVLMAGLSSRNFTQITELGIIYE